MSIPPFIKDLFVTTPPSQEYKAEESEKTVSDEFKKVQGAIHKAVRASQARRIENMKRLAPSISQRVETLQENFTELKKLCLEYCYFGDKISMLADSIFKLDDLELEGENSIELIAEQAEEFKTENAALEQQQEDAYGKMRVFIKKLVNENTDLEIKADFFSDWYHLNQVKEYMRELSLSYMEEQLLNRCINQLCFANDVKTVIKKMKEEIIRMFYSSNPDSLDLEKVSFDLLLEGSETHNRGKISIKIKFSLEGIELFSIFFKPRDAQIDEIVIQTFRDLNALSKEEKSSDISLPTYKIINKTQVDQCFSLWEFIEGNHPTENSVDDAIKVLSLPKQEKESLYQQLLRLESVCKFLNISDLHVQNLIFIHRREGKSQVVPIDLESIQPGNMTGLFSIYPKTPPLTEAERTLLEKSKERIGEVPARFVPVRTGDLEGGLSRCDNFILLAVHIRKAIQDRGYRLCVPYEELELYVLNDFLNHDVPFLTECKSQVYYWVGDQEELIGNRSW